MVSFCIGKPTTGISERSERPRSPTYIYLSSILVASITLIDEETSCCEKENVSLIACTYTSKVSFTFTVSTLSLCIFYGKKRLIVSPQSFNRITICTSYLTNYGFTFRLNDNVSFLVSEDPRYTEGYVLLTLSLFISVRFTSYCNLGVIRLASFSY